MGDDGVEIQKTSGTSKIMVAVISVLVISLIVGGVTWYYLSTKSTNTNTGENASKDTTSTTTSVSDAETINTSLQETLNQINQELSAMAADESSTEDATPSL